VVAVDDSSTDGTSEKLASLASRHSEIRVFRNQTNGGGAVSYNRVLAEARGEFVAFFDDDDYSMPERVEMQLNRILDYERNFAAGAPVICHTARRRKYPDGSDRIEPTMGQREGSRAPDGPAVARRILLGTPLADGYGACASCSQMARLVVYRSLGGFDPQFRRHWDTEFNIRLAKAGGHFVGIARPLVVQTMTKTSDKSLAEEYRNTLLLMDKHRDVMDSMGQYGFCRQWIDAKQLWLKSRRTDFALAFLSLSLAHPVLTVSRLARSIPNIGLNRALRRFYIGIES
jgi:GT2 family glycosyltransferase